MKGPGNVTISNLKFDPDDVQVTVNFEPAVHGNYTVDGEPITESTSITKSSLQSYQLVAVPDEGYSFVSWYNLTKSSVLSEDSEYTLQALEDCSITALFAKTSSSETAPFCVNSTYFDSFEDARTYANGVGADTVVLVQDYTLTEDLTVPEGITLLIPFNDAHDCFTDEFALTGGDPRVNNSGYQTPSPYKTLTVANGVTLTVNGGLSVSAQHFASAGSSNYFGPTGPCGYIYLDSGSELTVNGGLYAYGYVYGPGHVTVNSGAVVYELMQIAGFRGGSATINMVGDEHRVFPLSQYYVQNVESEMTLYAGAEEYVVASLQPGEGTSVTSAAPFIHPTDGMFRMSEGVLTKSYHGDTDRLELDVDGVGAINSLTIDMQAVISGLIVDSAQFVLPITNNISINVNGGSIALGQDIAFLPGTQVNVAEDATVEVKDGNKVYVYDRDEWMTNYFSHPKAYFNPILFSPSQSYTRTTADLVDAKMDVNGKLIVNGEAYTTESGAEIITSGHSGFVTVTNEPGEETETYQYDQSKLLTINRFVSIAINPVWLKNGPAADEPFTETADADANVTFGWSEEEDRWVLGVLVSFDANGGEGTMDPQFILYDSETPLTPHAFTKEGFKFVGWAVAPDSDEVYYTEAEGENIYGGDENGYFVNLTLYAVWQAVDQYNVTWIDGDGHQLKVDKVNDGQSPVYTGDEPTKTPTVEKEYVFSGWTDGETEYGKDEELPPVTGDITYTATFTETPREYRVTFNANGGEGTMAPQFIPYGTETALNDNSFTRVGYSFAGWATTAEGEVAYEDGANITITGDTALYAKWTEKYVTVTFQDEDGTELDSFEIQEGEVPEYTGETPTKEADQYNTYSFQGWLLGGTLYKGALPAVMQDTVFVASYKASAIRYSVVFLPNDGYFQGTFDHFENNPTPPISMEAGTQITMPLVVKNGYDFLGWTTDEAGEGTKYQAGDRYTVLGDVYFYAQYQVKTFTISFRPGEGATGEMADMSYEFGETKALTKNAFTREGYEFSCWMDNASNRFEDEQEITFTYNDDLILTAQWNLGLYTVSFDVDGGEPLSVSSFEVDGNDSITLPNTTKEHYELTGWKDKATEEVFTPGASYKVIKDVEFVAVWTPEQYTITFLNDDGEVLQTGLVDYGTMPEYTGEAPTKTATEEFEYTFAGWEPAIHEVDGEETYFATYSAAKRSYEITWVIDGETETTTVEYGDVPTHDDPSKAADAQYTYSFYGWKCGEMTYAAGNALPAVTGEATYEAVFTSELRSYTITWQMDDGTLIDTTTVEYGVVPTHEDPSKPATDEWTYTFERWEPELVAVTGEATYTATFSAEKRSYTITWKNDDGSVIDTTTVEYGVVPEHDDAVKASTAEYEFIFAGWDPEPVAVTGEAEYTATYTPIKRSYTITWKVDGSVYDTTTVEYGVVPTHDDPIKPATDEWTYTFERWEPELVAVTGDATYDAVFTQTKNKYEITWLMDDSTLIEKTMVEYGTVPTHEEPTKAADAQYTYEFAGWDPEPVEVTGTATYVATFNKTRVEYTITWKNDDGSVLKTESVPYGDVPSYGDTDPSKNPTAEYEFIFAGWDPEPVEVTGDAEYTATYTSITRSYLITWKNWDGTELQSDEVLYGELPEYTGDTPTKAADAQYTYEFAGWDPEVTTVSGEAIYTAKYTPELRSYRITFVDEDGTVLQSGLVAYGELPVYEGDTPTKEADEQYEYVFAGWDPTITTVTGEATYTATYTETAVEYWITFQNDNGDVLQSGLVAYGELPVYEGDTPTKEADAQYTYEFAGWLPEIAAVTGPVTYTATYTPTLRSYTVTWVVEGQDNIEEQYNYGLMPSYPGGTPTKEEDEGHTYVFDGWDPSIDTVTGPVTYTAQFKAILKTFTVIWKNEDGTVLETDAAVEYGTLPVYDGDTPTKAATDEFEYTFAGWTPDITEVTGDAEYTATYTETTRSYTITWQMDDGTLIGTTTVEYGVVPTHDEPTKAETDEWTYTFTGWDPDPVAVTGEATYKAVFSAEKRSYTITWKVDGQEDLVEEYEYGETPSYKNGATPTKAATAEYEYTFTGWDPAVKMVTGEATYTATFEATKRSYKITWLNEDGTPFATTTVEYGELPTHEAPIKEPGANEDGIYTFAGWDPTPVSVTGEATYTATFSYTGWRSDDYGKKYYIADEVQSGWLVLTEGKYYLDPDDGNYAAVSRVAVTEEGDPGHAFNADGLWMEGCEEQVFKDLKTGDIYLIENGIVEVYPGLYRTAGHEYYYFGEDNKAVRGQVAWVEKNQSNPDDETDRGLLPKWDYKFGEDGIIVHENVELNGIVQVDDEYYYYIDGIRVHYGMFELDGDYYYADRDGKLITSQTYWCTDNYGLKEEGPYTFDEYGRMITVVKKNGIYYEADSLFFYKNGSLYYAGLIYVDESNKVIVHYADGATADAEEGYYYVKTNGELAHSRNYWITKTNDLLPEKSYAFEESGKMNFKTGIYEEDGSLYYYKDGLRFYAGLIEIEGAYYYVKTDGEVVHGRSYWISKTNGLVPEKSYVFGVDGKMVLDVPVSGTDKNGIVEENGSLWYFENGQLTYAGLIYVDENTELTIYLADGTTRAAESGYYYVKTNGEVVHGRSYWITKTNGLLAEKSYTFDEYGKIIL